MDSLRRILAFSLLSSLLVLPCHAGHAFNWGFGPNFVQSSFRECEKRPINLIPLNDSTTDLGVAPYYMMAFAPGGTTIVASIGSDPSSLSWQIQHPKGSSVLPIVIDSVGQTGGFAGQFFDIVDGDTSCQPPAPTNAPVVHPNVTTTINTCDPWGLTITGGVKPYNISLAAVASPVVTNVTMGPEDDVFTFIDRADPGSQILAAVVDATGQWGVSSIAVNTAGSKDTTCIGLGSTSKTKAQIQAEEAAADAAAKAQAAQTKKTATALGIVFGLVLPLLLAGVGFWWWRRRRRLLAQQPRPWDSGMQEHAPERPSLNVDTNVVRVDPGRSRTQSWVMDINGNQMHRSDSPTSIDMTSTEIRPSTVPTPFLTSPHVQSSVVSVSMAPSPVSQLPGSAPMSRTLSYATRSPLSPPVPAATTPNSTSPAATLTPAQRYRKVLEAHAEAQAARAARLASTSGSRSGSLTGSSVVGSPGPIAGPSSSSSPSPRPVVVHRSQSEAVRTVSRSFPAQPMPRRAGSSLRLPPVSAFEQVGPDIIIQHRDGGIIEELPPPYPTTPAPRSARSSGEAREPEAGPPPPT